MQKLDLDCSKMCPCQIYWAHSTQSVRISRVKIFECQTYFYQCSALQVPWGSKLPKKQTRYNFSFIIFIIINFFNIIIFVLSMTISMTITIWFSKPQHCFILLVINIWRYMFVLIVIIIDHQEKYGCLASNTNTKYKLIIDPQGKYECVATNTVGTEYSYSAQLYVRGLCHHYSSFLNMNHQKRIRYTEHSFCQNTFWTFWTSLTCVVEQNSLIDYQCLWIARLFNILSEVPFSVAVSQQIITW